MCYRTHVEIGQLPTLIRVKYINDIKLRLYFNLISFIVNFLFSDDKSKTVL